MPRETANEAARPRVGFVGLGNVGAKLAGSLLRDGVDLVVRDLDRAAAEPLLAAGAGWADSPAELAAACDVVITCLPNPAASAAVLESGDGVLAGWRAASPAESAGGPGARRRVWAEMSTTDAAEVRRLAALVAEAGAAAADCPVSGGCHRAASGNISIFVGCERDTFEVLFPLLSAMGRRILHTGPLGSASVLKVVTNYLASANLVSLCEALVTSAAAGMDLRTTYEAIAISSGNSFVHETESQVMLNGSRDINFTMDLVCKDISLFDAVARRNGVELELSPLLLEIFQDAQRRYGGREWSPNVVRRLEDATGISVRAPGFPAEMVDDEPPQPGVEVTPRH
ncbi:MAG TPA: 3-hydroxyisobutyrate dehydrogenase [Acidimicrobiaceae bacterium]|nr:3-hydroxyisobutyrate dehydrogenase [Acidimicrobiaceae bacterium]